MLLLLACSSPPASIDAKSPVRVVDDRPFGVEARALDARGRFLPDVPVQVVGASGPAVVEGGKARCTAGGVGSLELEAGPVRATVELRCELVSGVQGLPAELTLGVGEERALTLRSEPVEAPLLLRCADPAVASVSPEGQVRALASGRTNISVRSGNFEKSFPLVVGEVLVNEPVAGGWSMDLPGPAAYLVEGAADGCPGECEGPAILRSEGGFVRVLRLPE